MGANAQTTVPTFTAAQVLTADQMNQSARTGVPVFADATARDAGFGGTGEKVLAEGQLCYLESTNVVQYYDGATWATVGPSTSAVVQVLSTAKTDTFTTTNTTFTDITGLSVTVTPTSASNKIFVVAFANVAANSAVTEGMLVLLRDSTEICIGDAAGSRDQASSNFAGNSVSMVPTTITFLDSPATTSAVTYKLQTRATIAAQSVFVNRTVTDSNTAAVPRAASTITVFEVTP